MKESERLSLTVFCYRLMENGGRILGVIQLVFLQGTPCPSIPDLSTGDSGGPWLRHGGDQGLF